MIKASGSFRKGSRSDAISLRKKGISYNEISKAIYIPKSTLSGWFRDSKVSAKIKQKNLQRAKLIWAKNISEFNKKRSLKYKKMVSFELEKASKEIPSLSKRDIFFIGLGLFLAEGGKNEKWSIRFVNSDPLIIKMIMKFFEDVCHADKSKFRARIHLHDSKKYKESLNYWSKIANIPMKNFWQPQFVVSKSSRYKRKSGKLKMGILHIAILDAKLTRKIKGWVMGLSRQFENYAELAQR